MRGAKRDHELPVPRRPAATWAVPASAQVPPHTNAPREFAASGVAAGAVGSFEFGAGQGAFAGSGAASAGEVPALLGGLADGVPFGPVAVQVGDAAVAADELDDDMDVVVAVDAQAVVDGDPAAAAASVAVGAEAEAVDGFFDDLAPSFVAEQSVFGGE